MMVIKDLAERWGVSVADAKRIVREEKVPFISLCAIGMNIRWGFVRFDPQAVAAWEGSRVRVAGDAPKAAPATVVMRRLR